MAARSRPFPSEENGQQLPAAPVDLRVEKEFTFRDFGATLSLEGFNLANANTVLQRQRSATSGSFDYITETLSPRVFRLGLRLSWK